MEPLLPSPLLVLAVVADEVLAPQASKGGKEGEGRENERERGEDINVRR